jgi:hypothetical protein
MFYFTASRGNCQEAVAAWKKKNEVLYRNFLFDLFDFAVKILIFYQHDKNVARSAKSPWGARDCSGKPTGFA